MTVTVTVTLSGGPAARARAGERRSLARRAAPAGDAAQALGGLAESGP